MNGNGFSVRVSRDSLLEDSFIDVAFYQRDEQGGGSTQTFNIPRSVILGDLTQDELDFRRIQATSGKFAK